MPTPPMIRFTSSFFRVPREGLPLLRASEWARCLSPSFPSAPAGNVGRRRCSNAAGSAYKLEQPTYRYSYAGLFLRGGEVFPPSIFVTHLRSFWELMRQCQKISEVHARLQKRSTFNPTIQLLMTEGSCTIDIELNELRKMCAWSQMVRSKAEESLMAYDHANVMNLVLNNTKVSESDDWDPIYHKTIERSQVMIR